MLPMHRSPQSATHRLNGPRLAAKTPEQLGQKGQHHQYDGGAVAHERRHELAIPASAVDTDQREHHARHHADDAHQEGRGHEPKPDHVLRRYFEVASWVDRLIAEGGTQQGFEAQESRKHQAPGYAPAPEARIVAKQLFLFIALYQAVDALQVTAAFILRGYRVAFWPMCIYAFSLWGVGLFGGYLLAFNHLPFVPESLQGASGFWAGNSLSLAIAASGLLFLFRLTAKRYAKY